MDKGATESDIRRMLQQLHARKLRGYVIHCSDGIVAVDRSDATFDESYVTSQQRRSVLPIIAPYASNSGSLVQLNAIAAGESTIEKAVGVGSCDLMVVEVGGPRPTDLVERIKSSIVGELYYKYLKRHTLVRRQFSFLARNIVGAAATHWGNRFGSDRVERRRRPLIRLSDYVDRHALPTTRLADQVSLRIAVPQVFPKGDRACVEASEAGYDFPDVFVAEISHGAVQGGSSMAVAGDSVVCHDLYKFDRELSSEELHRRVSVEPGTAEIRLLRVDRNPEHISTAATFIDACAHNYAHWLTEVLPRIAAFCSSDKHRDVPLLVDAGLHENIMTSLKIVAGPERVIITLPGSRVVRADRLYVTSVAGYVPFQRRPDGPPDHSHGTFNTHCLELVRAKIAAAVECLPAAQWPEKVYLRRNSGTRGIQNAAELESELTSRGFVTIAPETLSFHQQVQLFSTARRIIAPTGAAIANAIFCKSGAKVGVMMGKHPDMIYRYWLNMLAPLGHEVSYVLGEQTSNRDLGIHADYAIDRSELLNLLAEWERT